MTNKQVCEAFSRGETSGRSNNMFINGDSLYSYGYHYQLSLRSTFYNHFYINNKKYSKTTTRHAAILKNVLGSHGQTFFMSGVLGCKGEENGRKNRVKILKTISI